MSRSETTDQVVVFCSGRINKIIFIKLFYYIAERFSIYKKGKENEKSRLMCNSIQLFKAEFMLLCYVLLSKSLKPVLGIEPRSQVW